MINYKKTQISYLISAITILISALFSWIYITASNETPSINSGPNFAISFLMLVIILILSSLTTLTISINETYLQISFGYGFFRKKITLKQIDSVQVVKNHWYCGPSIKVWFWIYLKIYSIAGLNTVEIIMKDKKIYRIGSNEPEKLKQYLSEQLNNG